MADRSPSSDPDESRPPSVRGPAGDAARPRADPDDEAIDEIGEESFPASDSPSSWSGPPERSH